MTVCVDVFDANGRLHSEALRSCLISTIAVAGTMANGLVEGILHGCAQAREPRS